MSAIEHIEVVEQVAVVEQPNPLSAIMEAIQAADLTYQDTYALGMYLLNQVSKHVLPNQKFKTPALKSALLSGTQEAPKKRGRPPKVSKETLDEIKDSGKAAADAIASSGASLPEGTVKKPRGRPPMTEEEKAANKAKKLAAAATAAAAAAAAPILLENADMEELATELEKSIEEVQSTVVAPEQPKVRKIVKRATPSV